MYPIDNYYQLTPSEKPYIVAAFGLGNIGYHGPNRDISKSTLSFIDLVHTTPLPTTIPTTQSTTTTTAPPKQSFFDILIQWLKQLLGWSF